MRNENKKALKSLRDVNNNNGNNLKNLKYQRIINFTAQNLSKLFPLCYRN